MIDVTRFNGKSFVLNAELIEVMEESVEEVYSKVITYKRNIIGNLYASGTDTK